MKNRKIISTLALILALLVFNVKAVFCQIDVGITAIINPTCSVIPGVPEPVIVVITNFGNTTMTTYPIGCTINGGIPTVATWNGFLAPSVSDTFEFPILFNFPSGPFSFCAYALPGDANSTNDTTCIFCNGSPMSVNASENYLKNKIIIQPNPTIGIFSLTIEDKIAYSASIAITNILGKVVWRSDILKQEFNIDFSNEPSGLYLIILKTPYTVSTSKLFVIK
ncbi:MAG: T9SS type A sorting domain-containing protein [Bacteroidetes bacterium]|nr:T9SS type A sorting domain-containing protein [Bacteroidota bacterium]